MSGFDVANSQLNSATGDLVWEVGPIAEVIDRTPRQTHYMLSKGVLPAKKVGGRWVASRKALTAFLTDFLVEEAA